ncbi:hypothetical protein [Burkholderia cenocepacia]|uniref:hypothetical protein n=1 Tax=Burkholderia cenocepacia TaxID=95486 RepID=UPI001BA4988C|nr:hypothetical protein [Burkholderia cenocepacia]
MLTTKSPAGGYESFDPVSNKSILYEAADGLFTLSYSGRAHIGTRTTDEWIAAALDESVDQMFDNSDPDPSAVCLTSGKSPRYSMTAVVDLIRRRLVELEDSVFEEHGIAIAMAGWGVNAPDGKPDLFELRRVARSNDVQVNGFKRRPWIGRNTVVSMIGSGYTSDVECFFGDRWAQIHSEPSMAAPERNSEYLQALQGALVDTIRQASTTNQTVGANVHLNSLYAAGGGQIAAVSQFFGVERHPTLIRRPNSPIEVPDAAMTGWILFPTEVYAPSYLVGTKTHKGNFTTIHQIGIVAERGPSFVFRSVERRRA